MQGQYTSSQNQANRKSRLVGEFTQDNQKIEPLAVSPHEIICFQTRAGVSQQRSESTLLRLCRHRVPES